MNKIITRTLLLLAMLPGVLGCTKTVHDVEPLVDPWLRERTPASLRLESQIGAAIISDDWQDDAVGTISVRLITSRLDMSRVKVESLDFKFPDSEYCPTATIGAGSTIDLTSGSASFVVTAYNGETRTYTITYSNFSDPLEGAYTFTPRGGILDAGNAPKCAMILFGGWDGELVCSTVMDKWWHWRTGYKPTDEDDNTISFALEKADPETGATFGTLVNTPGDNGLYANYVYFSNDSAPVSAGIDVNDRYRIFPVGKGRWSKNGDGYIYIYAYEDSGYTNALYRLQQYEAGDYTLAGKTVTVASLAFARSFEGPFNIVDKNYPDTRWYTDNLRSVIVLMQKDSDAPVAGHDEFLAQ